MSLKRKGRLSTRSRKLKAEKRRLTGTLQGHQYGYAFLRPDQKEEDDVFIPAGRTRGSIHGDKVMVELESNMQGKKREGRVVSILENVSPRLVGTFFRENNRCWVVPDQSKNYRNINLSRKDIARAKNGYKVVVEIDRPTGKIMMGKIVETIGPADSPGVDMLSLIKRYALPESFPEKVMKELATLPGEEDIVPAAIREERRDLRNLLMVTIDPEEARDMDDAVSLQELPGGGSRLGVHIADVSYYVREGSSIYKEALKRGTSVYLVDRVIHMLPPLLSESLCSLQEARNRMAMSVEIDLNAGGEVERYDFYTSLVNVKKKLSYGEAENIITGEANDCPAPLKEMLRHMDRVASVLKEKRLKRGALDLNIPEANIKLDQSGKPILVERKERRRSEFIVEEFMLVANEVVAGHFYRDKLPFVYRVHARPQEEKMEAFKTAIGYLGINLRGKLDKLKPVHLQKVLNDAKGAPAEKTANYLLLRSLPQARYSNICQPHFGLAARYYCHFTSPIRRFPDLQVHSILRSYLDGGLTPQEAKRIAKRLPLIAESSSLRERTAMECERESKEIKMVEYMEGSEGEVYSGSISGVTSFGIFVELENTIEGMVHLNDLTGDHYLFDEKQMALIGRHTRKVFRLGDPVTVQVVKVSRQQKSITFQLV